MIIVYAKNRTCIESKDYFREKFSPEKVVFRNADRHGGEVEPCEKVVIVGDFPGIQNAYENVEVEVIHEQYPPVQQKASPPPKERPVPAKTIEK